MRQLRILLLIFFIATAVVFGIYFIHDRTTSDNKAPVISAPSDTIEAGIDVTEEDLLSGMTATDNLDGDVTDTLSVISKSKFIKKGTLIVNYAAFDKNNNVGTYSRELTYTDYRSPRFRLTSPLCFSTGTGSGDFLKVIEADDCLDGDITQQIKASFGTRTSTSAATAKQTVNIQVTNSAGDTAVLELTAELKDYELYALRVPALSEYLVYTDKGHQINAREYISGIWSAGKTTQFKAEGGLNENNVIVRNNVDPGTPGIYTVTYRFSGEDAESTLLVVVEE